jgi:hypothetical protein
MNKGLYEEVLDRSKCCTVGAVTPDADAVGTPATAVR